MSPGQSELWSYLTALNVEVSLLRMLQKDIIEREKGNPAYLTAMQSVEEQRTDAIATIIAENEG